MKGLKGNRLRILQALRRVRASETWLASYIYGCRRLWPLQQNLDWLERNGLIVKRTRWGLIRLSAKGRRALQEIDTLWPSPGRADSGDLLGSWPRRPPSSSSS